MTWGLTVPRSTAELRRNMRYCMTHSLQQNEYSQEARFWQPSPFPCLIFLKAPELL